MKSLFKTVFIIIFFTGLTRLAGFLFRIYLSRKIGAESLGVYQISFSIFMVLLTLIASGLPLIVSRQTAKFVTEKNPNKEFEMVTCATIIALTLSIILSVLVLVLQVPLGYIFADKRCISILLTLLPALVFSSVYCVLRGNLWGKNRYIATCSAELFEQVIRIIFCVILLSGIFPNITGEIGASLSLSIACVFSCIFVIILYIKSGGKFKKAKMYKEIIKTSMPITGIRLASSLIQPLISLVIPIRLMVAGYTQSQAVSLFGIATGMTMPLLFIPMTIIGSLSYALIPDLSSANAKGDTKYISQRVTNSLVFSLFVAFLLVPLFCGAGQKIGIFFFDNAQCGILLEKSAWVIIPICLTNISSSILNAVGLEIKSFRNYIVGGIFMLLGIWILPIYVGIDALIYSMGICFTFSAILNIKMIQKKVCPSLSIKKYFVYFVCFSVPTLAITSFLVGIFSNFFSTFFTLAISCTVGTIFFVILCIIFNIFKISSIIVFVKNSLNSKKIKQKTIKKV